MAQAVILSQYVLSDVTLAVIKTSSHVLPFTTASEVETEEVVQEGEEQTLIIKKKVIANRPAENTVLGYDITLVDNVFCPEVMKVLQGGKTIPDEFGGMTKGYEAPIIGTASNKEKFDLELYSAVVSTDGDTGQFAKITYPTCKGNSVPLNFKDGEYSAPEYTINSRPAQGMAPYKVEVVDALPEFELETVLISGNSSATGTAADSKITSITTGKVYRVIDLCTNDTFYTTAEGTLTDTKAEKAAISGTEITGLTNGHTYMVDEIPAE